MSQSELAENATKQHTSYWTWSQAVARLLDARFGIDFPQLESLLDLENCYLSDLKPVQILALSELAFTLLQSNAATTD